MPMADWWCPDCGQRQVYRGEQKAPDCILCERPLWLDSTEQLDAAGEYLGVEDE